MVRKNEVFSKIAAQFRGQFITPSFGMRNRAIEQALRVPVAPYRTYAHDYGVEAP